MQYFGGKFRIKKHLWPILNEAAKDRPFVDLFCGACNIVEGITTAAERVANDNNPYLIAMWKALQQGWEPPTEVDEAMYKKAMAYELPAPECGFISHGCSRAGKCGSGYARSGGRNYAREAHGSLLRQRPLLAGVDFRCEDFAELAIPDGAVVYCDPPYKGMTCGYYSRKFDYDRFIRWVDANKGRLTIFVSEYKENANPAWEIVWEKESRQSIRSKGGVLKKTVEILQLAK